VGMTRDPLGQERGLGRSLVFRSQGYFLFKLFVCLFLVLLGLHCYVRAFSSCCEQELLFAVVHGLRTVVAALIVEHMF
jgi:hypothetical protein